LTYLSEEPQSEVHNADKYLIEMQSFVCSACSHGCPIGFYHAFKHGDHESIEFVVTRRVDLFNVRFNFLRGRCTSQGGHLLHILNLCVFQYARSQLPVRVRCWIG